MITWTPPTEIRMERLYARPLIEVNDYCDCDFPTRPCCHVGVFQPADWTVARLREDAAGNALGYSDWTVVRAFYVRADAEHFLGELVDGKVEVWNGIFHDWDPDFDSDYDDSIKFRLTKTTVPGTMQETWPRYDIEAQFVLRWSEAKTQ